MNSKKRILVAPLNWGLGHATRCIPIINALLESDLQPIIASDGEALVLLKKEFPALIALELPSYGISYPRKGSRLKLKLLKDSPKILNTIKEERKTVDKIIEDHVIIGIISDNRFGVRSDKIPSVFITHQINVLSGNTSWLTSILQKRFISKFDACWVPDVKGEPNLSGQLGHDHITDLPLRYIGPISRFRKLTLPIIYDLMVILSGPEPQRSILEEKLLADLRQYTGHILFVKGKIVEEQRVEHTHNMTIYNFMLTEDLEKTINQSHVILSRSGYTTIMDLAALEKKAFFIPTPGQFEQEYLSEYLSEQGIAPYSKQDQFRVERLDDVKDFKGFKRISVDQDLEGLFSLFKRE